MPFDNNNILVYDIESSSLDTETAKLQWFGAYSYSHNEFYLLPFKGNEKEILALIQEHKILVGFNSREFDNKIIMNNLKNDDLFNFKVIVDLLEISAPKSGKSYAMHRKNRLAQMGFKLKNFTLKNIIEELKLDRDGTKGDIDYKIFQKDEWTADEIAEIKKYLRQDINLTKLLFEWYEEQFSPLKRFLPKKERENLLYIKSSLASLAYNIICYKAGLPVEFGERTGNTKPYEGGHHIDNKRELIRGSIYNIDVQSCYPNCVIMGNLCTPVKEGESGWNGKPFFELDGVYNNKEQGKVVLGLKDLLLERLKAKKEGDKPKNLSYKIIINGFYGTIGSAVFKSVYNRNSASDCTSMARTILKKLAKNLDVNGFEVLGGFTDNIFILVPPHLNKNHLMYCVNKFIKEVLSNVPFQMPDTFTMGIEEEIKMIWFVTKNCYLFVTNKDEVKYKSTLLNANTPKAVMKLFEEYIKSVIISKLDIPFTKNELIDQMKVLIAQNPELGAQEYKVTDKTDYKVTTSLQYQICERYGPGRHFLIPNRKGIGVGLAKGTKKVAAIRHCSMEEFKNNNLQSSDIDISHLISHLSPFYERNEVFDDEEDEDENDNENGEQ